uniref:Uncharacterized protein n=1 Tax=Globisporangium ultimum (strain ATCC 200006 / CBS 805.95 / DAOM BR144) TaxID=431595 RepID=K3WQP2_GLOUD
MVPTLGNHTGDETDVFLPSEVLLVKPLGALEVQFLQVAPPPPSKSGDRFLVRAKCTW